LSAITEAEEIRKNFYDPRDCKHADESGSVENVMKIEIRYADGQGEDLCSLIEDEKTILASI